MNYYPLPKGVTDVLNTGVSVSNLGLLFHKYLSYPNQKWQWSGEAKNRAWKKLEIEAKELISRNTDIIEAIEERMVTLRSSYIARGFKFAPASDNSVNWVDASVCWRLAIGLGTASVWETGITLHHIYGIPYIPASGVKGLVRNYRLSEVAKELGVPLLNLEDYKKIKTKGQSTPIENLEGLLMADKEEEQKRILNRFKDDVPIKKLGLNGVKQFISSFSNAFGSMNQKGKVIFFDAFPIEVPEIELDIINTHYGEYYREKNPEPPADYLSPVPVYFLTVGKDSKFRFSFASKDTTLLGEVEDWLKESIQRFGVGAKTRAGYGEIREVEAK